jgi:hypothetical protein
VLKETTKFSKHGFLDGTFEGFCESWIIIPQIVKL